MAVKTEAEKRARLDAGLPKPGINAGKAAKNVPGSVPTKSMNSAPGRGNKSASVGS